MTLPLRKVLAERRLLTVLKRHAIATARTLEQKISDAGPFNQRIDPHILTNVRRQLQKQGLIALRTSAHAVPWYYLPSTPANEVQDRFIEQDAVHQQFSSHAVLGRIGQALEIAVFRAFQNLTVGHFFGAYIDLDVHTDDVLYHKEEPPSSVSGKTIQGGKKLDFLLLHPTAGAVGIEVKNVREWLYPDRDEIRDMLLKCCQIDAVPVLIARRIPFVTFRLLNPCGVIVHQTYNQRLAQADDSLAVQARDKNLLAYHDITVGNALDPRLHKFVVTNLPNIVEAARHRFEEYRDLLEAYAYKRMPYHEFAARVRRRQLGQNEDSDFDAEPDHDY
jgi:hypothetical protein